MKSLNSCAKSASVLSVTDAAKDSVASSDVPAKDHSALAYLESGNVIAVSLTCEGKLLNNNSKDGQAQSTLPMSSHAAVSSKVQKDAPLEQLAIAKSGTEGMSCIEASVDHTFCLVPSYSQKGTISKLISDITECNGKTSKHVSQDFHRVLPSNSTQFNISELFKATSLMKNDKRIQEKIGLRKWRLKFKERILPLNLMTSHHLWKKHQLLLPNNRGFRELNKLIDTSSHQSHSGFQRMHSSICRFVLPDDNLVTNAEVLKVLSKLLLESHIKVYRSSLRMPAMIIDKEERESRKFVNKNSLIEDPLSFEVERSRVNPWSQQEKEVFVDMLVTFGKDFAKISSFLSHKKTADCIEYYYKNNKTGSFVEAKKRVGTMKESKFSPSSSYLETSGRKCDRERNAAALYVLGESTVAETRKNGNQAKQ